MKNKLRESVESGPQLPHIAASEASSEMDVTDRAQITN